MQNHQTARDFARRDFETNCADEVRRLIDFPPDSVDEVDLELGVLDVCQFFVEGAEDLWPELNLRETFQRWSDPLKTQLVFEILPVVIKYGGWRVDGEMVHRFTAVDLKSLSCVWMPEAFSWRGLPALLAEQQRRP